MEISVRKKILSVNISGMFSGFKGGWYLADYIPKSPDRMSSSIVGYKLGDPFLCEKWNAFTMEQVSRINLSCDYVVRALAAGELVSNGIKPLDDLCRRIAAHFSCEYFSELLVKKRKVRPLHGLLKDQRRRELHNVYEVNPSFNRDDPCNILIIDDVLTTGTTINSIRKALRKRFSVADIYLFTVAKTINKYAKEPSTKY